MAESCLNGRDGHHICFIERLRAAMSGVYKNGHLRFAYPENWTIEEDEGTDAAQAVTASSAETAFWSVLLYEGTRNLAELVDCVVHTMMAEYPQLERDPAESTIDNRYPDPPGAFGYDLSFSYVDLMNSALLRAFHHEGNTFLVLAQAEDHELERVEPVFRAMTMSLTAR
jgi:hypothetical protein